MLKNIGIGIDDFKEIIEQEHYFVDKSLFIKDIIDDGSKVKLITRPRRFGKTLNMSMLKYFFDVVEAEENRKLFNGLKIETVDDGKYIKYQGGNPVVYISMKGLNATDSVFMHKTLRSSILNLFLEFEFITKELEGLKLQLYNELLLPDSNLSNSLKFLCQILNGYYGKKAILLIDEYDAPLLSAYSNGYYNEVIDFFKAFYTDALKGNEYIETAVMTGITRVAKESIFSGLNNLSVYTILKNDYKEYFGFNEEEVMEILEYYKLGDDMSEVQDFYDGYHFGNHKKTKSAEEIVQVIDMYNPWSIINYAKEKILQSYWINTSGDSLIKDIAKKDIKNFINACTPLIRGESIEIIADEFVTLQNVGRLEDIWTLLLHSGYLTVKNHIDNDRYESIIPNAEIKTYFAKLFDELLSENSNYGRTINLIELLFEDFEYFEDVLNNRTLSCVSNHDLWRERDYHNLLLGALFVNSNQKYQVISQRESGLGRPDILVTKRALEPCDDITYVFEMKFTKDENQIEAKLKEASEQIKTKKYADTLAGKVLLVPVVACNKNYYFKIEDIK